MASEAVLCIDLGSTETRAVVAVQDPDKIRKRIIENRNDAKSILNGYNQFSSRILVHDDQEDGYIGNRDQSGREESSAKFGPYILARTNESMMEQYPILGRLLEEKRKIGDEALDARLEQAFDKLLCFVLKATKSVLEQWRGEQEQIRIRTVALTIPSQWNLDFEDLYRRLFLQAFRKVFANNPELAAPDVVVEFHTEADALAYYIFHKSLRKFRFGGRMPDVGTILKKTNAQCLIDCGGHNANSTLTTFHRNNDGNGALCQLRKPEGAGGGSEMMIYDIVDQLIKQYRDKTDDQTEISHHLYQKLKQQTINNLGHIMGEASQFVLLTCTNPQTDKPLILTLTTDMCKQAFETGFKYVKGLIKKQLRKLANIRQGWGAKEHIVSIIVSGGSSRHPEFSKWIKALCMNLGLPEPLFTKEMDMYYGACRIAMGGAYASLTTQSVESFAEKCAFALQKCNVTRDENGSTHLDKEESARTIWQKERGAVPVMAYATGDTAEYRIVCQPFVESSTDTLQTDRSGAESASYDFLEIGTLPDCNKYRIDFKLRVEEKQVELKLYGIPFSTGRTAKETLIDLGSFPVHVQPGTRNLVIHQLSSDDIDEQIRDALAPYRDGSDQANNAAGDDSSDGDDYSAGDGSSDDDDTSDDDDYQPRTSQRRPNIAARTLKSKTKASQAAGNTNAAPATGSSASRRRTPDGAPGPSSGGGRFHGNNGTDGNIDDDQDGDDDGAPGPSSGLDNIHWASDTSPGSEEGTGGQDLNQAARTASHNSKKNENARREEEAAQARPEAAPSASRGVFASKAHTRNATNNAFRSSKDVSGKAAPNNLAGSGAPGEQRGTTPGARLGHGAPQQPNNNPLSSGVPSSSRHKAHQTQESNPKGRKRQAPPEADNRRPEKRVRTSGGHSSSSRDNRRKNAPSRQPTGYQGTAFWNGQTTTAPDTRPVSPARRDNSAARRSNDRGQYELNAPSRRPAGAQAYDFSERYRGNTPGFPTGLTARRNPSHNVSLGGPTPIGPTALRPPREGSTAPEPWTSAAGDAAFRRLSIRSPSPDSGNPSARSSGPVGSSRQHPRDFNGFRRANRNQGPSEE